MQQLAIFGEQVAEKALNLNSDRIISQWISLGDVKENVLEGCMQILPVTLPPHELV